MKKMKLLVALGICGLVLGACEAGEESGAETTETQESVVEKESSIEQESAESVVSELQFKDNKLITNEIKIEITDVKVIPAGETGNEYGEKPVIAFWYDTTNLTEEKTDPSSAWIFSFQAYQDNNENSLNELNIASLPDDQFIDSQTESIKEGGTVSNAMAYELDDDVTPVTLTATDMFSSEEIGSADYEIK